ncbi:MAG TPA: hypothetical protein VHB74_14320 [Devosia sp.]|nr:hypothetical protein [Devosia sp.]
MPDTSQHLRIGHPAPHRERAERLPLLFALCAAPAAWILQLLVGFAVTAYVCYPGEPRAALPSVPGWVQPVVIALNILGLAVAVLSFAVGLALIRATRGEHQARSGGIMDVGEGRTRFLATWSLFGTLVFAVALIANTFSLFLVPLCRA